MNKIPYSKIIICLTVFSAPLYLARFNFFSIPTNILELLIVLSFIFLAYEKKINLRKTFPQIKNYSYPILCILFGVALSLLVNKPYLSGLGIIKSWFFLPLLFSITILNSFSEKREIEMLLRIFYFSTCLVAIVSLFYFFNDNLTYDLRLKAFYLSPNYLAMFLAPGFIFGGWQVVAAFKKNQTLLKNTYFLVGAAGLFLVSAALYLTYSYAAWISIMTSFALVLFIKNNHRHKLKIGFILIFTLFLFTATQLNNPKFQALLNMDGRSSLASRITIWKASQKILADNFLFGIGPGNFQNKYLDYQKYFPPYLEWAVPQPHNLYLAFWLQSGILGFLGFLSLILLWIKHLIGILRYKKNEFLPAETALLGIMFYILIHGILDTTYWKNDLAFIFWLIITLGILTRQFYLRHSSITFVK